MSEQNPVTPEWEAGLLKLHSARKKREFQKRLSKMLMSHQLLFNTLGLGKEDHSDKNRVTAREMKDHFKGKLSAEIVDIMFREVHRYEMLAAEVSTTTTVGAVDKNSISYLEFHKYTQGKKMSYRRTAKISDPKWLFDKLKHADFKDLDTDSKDQVERGDLHATFDGDIEAHIVDEMFDSLDADGDGHVTPMELFKWRANFTLDSFHKLVAKAETKKATAQVPECSRQPEEEEEEDDAKEAIDTAVANTEAIEQSTDAPMDENSGVDLEQKPIGTTVESEEVEVVSDDKLFELESFDEDASVSTEPIPMSKDWTADDQLPKAEVIVVKEKEEVERRKETEEEEVGEAQGKGSVVDELLQAKNEQVPVAEDSDDDVVHGIRFDASGQPQKVATHGTVTATHRRATDELKETECIGVGKETRMNVGESETKTEAGDEWRIDKRYVGYGLLIVALAVAAYYVSRKKKDNAASASLPVAARRAPRGSAGTLGVGTRSGPLFVVDV